MKILYLFRHGDAMTNSDSDCDRKLSDAGIAMIVEYLKNENVAIDWFISMGAPRTKKYDIIAKKLFWANHQL